MRHAVDIPFTEDSFAEVAPTGYIPVDLLEDTTDWADWTETVARLEPAVETPAELVVEVELDTGRSIGVFSYDPNDGVHVEYIEAESETAPDVAAPGVVFEVKVANRRAMLKAYGGPVDDLWDIPRFDCWLWRAGPKRSWKEYRKTQYKCPKPDFKAEFPEPVAVEAPNPDDRWLAMNPEFAEEAV